tara:strand:- start:969 stop:1106 length:138 start_codon:yes stop_codon:yes gene_type:complete
MPELVYVSLTTLVVGFLGGLVVGDKYQPLQGLGTALKNFFSDDCD